jgi:hypothetical protein
MPASLTVTPRFSLPTLLLGLGVAVVLMGTLALWGYYGTAVFFEMVRAGWAACF